MNTWVIILLFVAVACCLVGNILLYFMIRMNKKDNYDRMELIGDRISADEGRADRILSYLRDLYGKKCRECVHYDVCGGKAGINVNHKLLYFMADGPIVLCNNYKEETNNGQSGTDENND